MKFITHVGNKNQQELFFAAIKGGLSRYASANYAGISPGTLHTWLRRAEREQEREITSEYTEWFAKLLRIEAELELELVTVWLEHTKTSWRAAQEFLRVRFAEQYGMTERSSDKSKETTIVITRDDS